MGDHYLLDAAELSELSDLALGSHVMLMRPHLAMETITLAKTAYSVTVIEPADTMTGPAGWSEYPYWARSVELAGYSHKVMLGIGHGPHVWAMFRDQSVGLVVLDTRHPDGMMPERLTAAIRIGQKVAVITGMHQDPRVRDIIAEPREGHVWAVHGQLTVLRKIVVDVDETAEVD